MGGVASAVGSIFGGGDDAAGDAANVQAASSAAAIAEQKRQFDLTREDFKPSVDAGNLARDRLQGLLGLGDFAERDEFVAFEESPGQKFLREQGQKALLQNASAIGGLGGGNVRQALVEHGIGTAAQDFGNHFNRLAGIAGAGQTAVANQANIGQNSVNNISSLLQDQGAARASGILGAQQQSAQTGQNLLSAGISLAGLFF